jgi:hypothetical protein
MPELDRSVERLAHTLARKRFGREWNELELWDQEQCRSEARQVIAALVASVMVAEPHPIEDDPPRMDNPERKLLLYCPDQGGWRMGVYFGGAWHDFGGLDYAVPGCDQPLNPTHWMPEPPEPAAA